MQHAANSFGSGSSIHVMQSMTPQNAGQAGDPPCCRHSEKFINDSSVHSVSLKQQADRALVSQNSAVHSFGNTSISGFDTQVFDGHSDAVSRHIGASLG
jgi:hypothetical protein